MSNTFSGTIAEVKTLKSGHNNSGRPWTLYAVVAEDGRRFTTFNGDWQKKIGQSVTFQFESKQNGEYVNYSILEPKPQRRNGQGPGNSGLILDKLGSIEAKLDMILGYIGERQKATRT